MNAEVKRILEGKSTKKIEWVLARVVYETDQEATKAIGYRDKSIYAWSDLKELKRAVDIIRHEKAMKNVEALCHQLPEEIRKTNEELREMVIGAMGRLVPMAIKAAEAKLKDGKKAPLDLLHMILDPWLIQPQQIDVENRMTIEYVNDWRPNPLTEPASGPDNGKATSKEVQLAVGGPALAKDNNGSVNSG